MLLQNLSWRYQSSQHLAHFASFSPLEFTPRAASLAWQCCSTAANRDETASIIMHVHIDHTNHAPGTAESANTSQLRLDSRSQVVNAKIDSRDGSPQQHDEHIISYDINQGGDRSAMELS